jgi:DNA-binding HxlR family transcriptional regulator
MKQEVTKRLLVKRITGTVINQQCAVIATLKLFATKWKPCILCYLAKKPMRYNELFRIIPNISRKMLSEHLKELEAAQLITRIQYDSKLQKVEYSLSARGKTLMPVLQQLQNWGLKHIDNVLSIQEMLKITVN